MNAVNPLLCPAFKIADDIRPGANAIALIPIGPGSRVDGMNAPSIRRLAQDRSGAMVARSGFRLTGDAGVAINIRDRSNETWYRHGVYRHTLRIDDSVAFDVRFDRAPVNEGQQISLYYSWPLLRAGKGRYEKLFVDGWHELPFLSNPLIGAGILSSFRLAPGLHTVSVRSEDIQGNATETVAEVTVEPQTDPGLPAWHEAAGSNGASAAPLDIDISLAGELVHVTAAAQGAFTIGPALTVHEGSLTRTLPMQLASRSRAVATFPPDPSYQGTRTITVDADVAGSPAKGERSRAVYVIEPERPGSFTVDGGALTVLWDSTSTFGPLALTVDHGVHNGQEAYTFGPEDAVLRNGFTVIVRPDRKAPRSGALRQHRLPMDHGQNRSAPRRHAAGPHAADAGRPHGARRHDRAHDRTSAHPAALRAQTGCVIRLRRQPVRR